MVRIKGMGSRVKNPSACTSSAKGWNFNVADVAVSGNRSVIAAKVSVLGLTSGLSQAQKPLQFLQPP